jgi:hypothetical protein
MSRNVMPELTDDTRVDLRRPIFDAPSTPIPAAVLPDLEPDEEDDAATIQLSRLNWPEPPLRLAERPRFVKTDGGVTAPAAPMSLLDQRPTFWHGLAVAVILAATFSVFVPRSRTQTRAATDASAPPKPVAAAPAPQPQPMPPLIITVGTPPSVITAAAPVGVAPKSTVVAAAPKAPVPVTKLPVARPSVAPSRPRPSLPVVTRAKPATPAPRATLAKSAPSSSDAVVDDGF